MNSPSPNTFNCFSVSFTKPLFQYSRDNLERDYIYHVNHKIHVINVVIITWILWLSSEYQKIVKYKLPYAYFISSIKRILWRKCVLFCILNYYITELYHFVTVLIFIWSIFRLRNFLYFVFSILTQKRRKYYFLVCIYK